MADVRLTATNPEDSSVVPVACDAAGRLLLEEPQVIEGPPGPPGEQGPPGQDGQDGDPFSGNFAGDVTFGGSANFAGDVFAKSIVADRSDFPASAVYVGMTNGALTSRINADGSAEFAGSVWNYNTASNQVGNGFGIVSTDGATNPSRNAGFTRLDNTSFLLGDANKGIKLLGNLGNTEIDTEFTGSAEFAGNKAGFTAEGYLWCTTRRGDTVILDFTSNGAGQWVQYTPPTRIEEIRDNLDANRGDTGEMPADTP